MGKAFFFAWFNSFSNLHHILLVVGFYLFQTYAAEGRFTFTSHTAGEHIICLHSNSSAWFASGQLVSWCTFAFFF